MYELEQGSRLHNTLQLTPPFSQQSNQVSCAMGLDRSHGTSKNYADSKSSAYLRGILNMGDL
jgi:hypothetical protein